MVSDSVLIIESSNFVEGYFKDTKLVFVARCKISFYRSKPYSSVFVDLKSSDLVHRYNKLSHLLVVLKSQNCQSFVDPLVLNGYLNF